MSPVALVVGWVVASYLLGCVNGAFYLHRLRTGADIRTSGSGNAGARNAWRVMGRAFFIPVFLVDAGKGALAAWGALALSLAPSGIALAVVAVVLGHVFPMQLGFRGGKGIATTLGAMLVVDPLVSLAACAGAVLFVIVLRRPALSGSLGVASLPLIGLAMERKGAMLYLLIALSALVILSHKAELAAHWRGRSASDDARV
jgi:glycerol-3-phosphate acyltransferase PlsY